MIRQIDLILDADNSPEDLNLLKELLCEAGADLRAERYQRAVGGEQIRVRIRYDDEAAAEKRKRGAGRKRKLADGMHTLSEVEEMMETLSGEETAEQLGISRATLYRKLSEARRLREEGEEDPYVY